ncbi:U11/U12 small nuclear ribonucleoprotein 48 kDa protein-like [Sipha flava]|uniref:U11/U12 small nuclear ribonucleoprotein 48 kDa protein-like n=2 Tax=Sipha flava TaxID=143950 RepID=A0A8B8FHX8_9HEMI|nr:U11/U12 small nuclear ribonucleoprotein 48 kDa protein-like [Sipha flava]
MELSSEELLCRKNTLKQFENYIHNATKTLENFTKKIGWSLDKTPTDDSLVKCTLKSKQKIPPLNFDGSHPKILEFNGYESLYAAYCSSSSSLKIDVKHESEKNAVDSTTDSLNLTADKRKVLYDSLTGKNVNPDLDDASKNLLVLDLFNGTNEKPKTELELLQEQRDLKRRRVAYRGKRVHTDRKSYIEVLREVVEGLTNSVSNPEDKSVCVETTSINTSASDSRCIFKYEGNRYFGGHPYTRWVDIKTEEYNLLRNYEEKDDSSHEETNISRIQHSEHNIDIKKSRRSRSLSRSRRRSSSGLKLKRSRRSRSRSKYKKSKRSRTPIKSNENKSIKSKTRSKSKEIMPKKSRSRSVSSESNQEKFKRHRARSNSNECSSKKKSKHSKSPLNYLQSVSNENYINKYKSSGSHKKKKKHKNKRKYSKSP